MSSSVKDLPINEGQLHMNRSESDATSTFRREKHQAKIPRGTTNVILLSTKTRI
jgi:hypothetical protein